MIIICIIFVLLYIYIAKSPSGNAVYIYIFCLIIFVWWSNTSHESPSGKWELLDVFNINIKFCHESPSGKWLIILNGWTSRVSFLAPSGGSVFVDLLRSEVLDGTNYVDWKQRVDMLLSYYGFKDIICVEQASVLPQLPSSESSEIADNIEEKLWERFEEVSRLENS